jgi:hypothetical protein
LCASRFSLPAALPPGTRAPRFPTAVTFVGRDGALRRPDEPAARPYHWNAGERFKNRSHLFSSDAKDFAAGVVLRYKSNHPIRLFMKMTNHALCLAAGLLALNLLPVAGQSTPPIAPVGSPPPGGNFQTRLQEIVSRANPAADQPSALTKFNLDFPGGTPQELVAAIEKATGKPLNVIIPPDAKNANAKLPPIKVNDMDVARLFNTLRGNSEKYNDRGELISRQGFHTDDRNPTDNSLWTFSVYEKSSGLTQFNLDFSGGTPAELVQAIEKAMGKPLNLIISAEDADTKLPPLKMNNVSLPQLFAALEVASRKTVAVPNANFGNSYSQQQIGFGFKTLDNGTDDSIWYFYVTKPTVPPVGTVQKTCRFYSLTAYLDKGFTVDDITTAIQTGWKMAGKTVTPELNYHKETSLLIAYGDPGDLQIIENVLQNLPAVSNDYWTKQFEKIRRLEQRVDELNRQLNPPPPAAGTLEIKGIEGTGK